MQLMSWQHLSILAFGPKFLDLKYFFDPKFLLDQTFLSDLHFYGPKFRDLETKKLRELEAKDKAIQS